MFIEYRLFCSRGYSGQGVHRDTFTFTLLLYVRTHQSYVIGYKLYIFFCLASDLLSEVLVSHGQFQNRLAIQRCLWTPEKLSEPVCQAHIIMTSCYLCFVRRCASIHDCFLHSLQQSKLVLTSRHFCLSVCLSLLSCMF